MATLTVTLTEAVSLGDGSTDRGTTNIQTISNIDEVDHRIMDIPTSWVDIIKFDAANSAGTFADGTVKYLRITNLGLTNYVNLRIRTAASEYFVKVELEDHFILGNNSMDAESGDAFGSDVSLANIDAIAAKADTASVRIEYFIASVSS